MVERGSKPETVKDQKSILASDIVDNILENARENLNKGQLNATLFVRLENGERGVVPLCMPGDFQEKQNYFQWMMLSSVKRGNHGHIQIFSDFPAFFYIKA